MLLESGLALCVRTSYVHLVMYMHTIRTSSSICSSDVFGVERVHGLGRCIPVPPYVHYTNPRWGGCAGVRSALGTSVCDKGRRLGN